MTIYAIVWDIGGVLERSASFENRRPIEEKFGKSSEELSDLIFGKYDGFKDQFGLISSLQHKENVAKELRLSAKEVDQVFEDYFSRDFLDLQLVEKIRELKKDYTIAVLSNYNDTLRPKIEEEWKIDDAFHQLFISCELGLMKPHADIYNVVIEKLGYQPSEIVFIDDFIENVNGARKVGIKSIHFQSVSQTLEAIEMALQR